MRVYYNPLNAELNPIRQLLVLLGHLTFMGPCIVSISNKMQCYTVSGSWFRASAITTTNKIQRDALYCLKSFKNFFIVPYVALHVSGTLVPIIRSL
jgi:hypothetical protein